MNEKEKAKEIVDKMLSKSPNIQDGISRIDIIYAKLCAKIAVNEIIEHGNLLSDSLLDGYIDNGFNSYWNEVLKEIDNI